MVIKICTFFFITTKYIDFFIRKYRDKNILSDSNELEIDTKDLLKYAVFFSIKTMDKTDKTIGLQITAKL